MQKPRKGPIKFICKIKTGSVQESAIQKLAQIALKPNQIDSPVALELPGSVPVLCRKFHGLAGLLCRAIAKS